MTHDATPDSPIYCFVGGAPRSGTTLIQRVIESHPSVLGGPEARVLPPIMQARRAVERTTSRLGPYGVEEGLDEHFRGLVDALLRTRPIPPEVRVVAEKTPENAEVLTDLLELFPDALAVGVLRDPRNVVASRIHVEQRREAAIGGGKVPPGRIQVLIASTRDYITAVLDAREALGDRMFTLHYEDFVSAPEHHAPELIDFLGLPWDARVLHPEDHSRREEQEPGIDGVWYTKSEFTSPIRAADPNAWKKRLSPGVLALVEAAFAVHGTWDRLPYEPTLPLGSPAVRRALHAMRHVDRYGVFS